MRAVAEIEEGRVGDRIVVTELPYQTSVEVIEQKISELVKAGELDGISGVLQRLGQPAAAPGDRAQARRQRQRRAEQPLQADAAADELRREHAGALVDGVPRTLNLAQALSHYVDHQIEVIRRRSQFRLDKARNRAHIVEGLLRAIDMLDAVIATIRASDDRPAARAALMAEPFSFTEVQATHILDMTLGRLTRLGRSELEEEMAPAPRHHRRARGHPGRRRQAARRHRDGDDRDQGQVRQPAPQHHHPRPGRARGGGPDRRRGDRRHDDRAPATSSRWRRPRSGPRAAAAAASRGPGSRRRTSSARSCTRSAHAYLLLFSNRGKVYRLRGHEIPMKDRTARGTAAVNLVPLAPNESITAIIATREFSPDQFLVFATAQGQVKKTALSEYDKSRREGFIAINLRDGDELVRVVATSGDDDLFEVTRNGMTIRFNEADVRPMGRDAAGVRGIRLRQGDAVVSLRRGGGRHRHPDRDRCRLRQADEARALQPPDARRPGRARHPADRHPGRWWRRS